MDLSSLVALLTFYDPKRFYGGALISLPMFRGHKKARLLAYFVGMLFICGLRSLWISLTDGVNMVNSQTFQQTQYFNTNNFAIPPRIIFTYSRNVLNNTHDARRGGRDRQIAQNVLRTIDMHRNRADDAVSVLFLDDASCAKIIKHVDSIVGGELGALTIYFESPGAKGALKADICRGAALFVYGGYYFDVDIVPRFPLWDLIHPKIEFVTARAAPWPPPEVRFDKVSDAWVPDPGSKGGNKHRASMFQAVWASTPFHGATLQYMRVINHQIKAGSRWWGVHALRDAYKAAIESNATARQASLLMQEGWLRAGDDPDVPRLNGTGCCCHAVVRLEGTVAFYSRFPGTGKVGSCEPFL